MTHPHISKGQAHIKAQASVIEAALTFTDSNPYNKHANEERLKKAVEAFRRSYAEYAESKKAIFGEPTR